MVENIGTFADDKDGGKAKAIGLITWCKATYGKLVYDVEIEGLRFQIDLDDDGPNKSSPAKLNKIKLAYQAHKANKDADAARKPTKLIEVFQEDELVIQEILAGKGEGILMIVPSSAVDDVQKVIDKVVVVTPKK